MKVKILPRITLPSKIRIQREHKPQKQTRDGGYQAYRECLRWEFGFSCAFCLLHEADLERSPAFAQRSGNFWIEHADTQSAHQSRANDYDNCFYACQYCNRSRGKKPAHTEDGRTLINPVSVAWADHFDVKNDRFAPKTEDATFTANQMYRMNDPLKVECRRERRQAISKSFELLASAPRQIAENTRFARKYANSDSEELRNAADRAHRAAKLWSEKLQESRKILERYRIVPITSTYPCSCGEKDPKLPSQLDEQGMEVEC